MNDAVCGRVFLLEPEGLDDQARIWLGTSSSGLTGISASTTSISVTVEGYVQNTGNPGLGISASTNHNDARVAFNNLIQAVPSACVSQTRTLASSYYSSTSATRLYLHYSDGDGWFDLDVPGCVRRVTWTFNGWLIP
jgi:hypothetical protein